MNLKLAAILIVLVGVLSRLLPHHPNIVPITALCLFGGTYLPKKFAFLPLLALLFSDYFIGFYGVDMFYVYGSFVLIGLIGLWLRKHKSAKFVLGSALFSSILFFIITNFGVWAPPNNWYPHTLSGLIQSYTMAIPFFRNSLIGDVGYTVLLFGGYEILQRLSKKYLSQKLFQLLY
ncbi:hypothetical protein HY383_03605 [Candidatus Daviesbacteria bacterium]|nr:hypothetical protein [Candidatus Daviesbacteria bacterium]